MITAPIIIFFFSILVTALPQGSSPQNPDGIKFRSIQYAGSGCPVGSLNGKFIVDKDIGSREQLDFSNFSVKIGANDTVAKDNKSCNITFSLEVPENTQVTVGGISTSHWEDLESGKYATLSAGFSITGGNETASLSRNYTKSTEEDVNEISAFVFGILGIYSQCGGIVNITVNSQISLQGGAAKLPNETQPRESSAVLHSQTISIGKRKC